jgi:hypothetical protein
MRQLRPSNEAEMVALFLRTELGAARFQADFRALLARAGLPERIITDPDLDNAAENQARRQLLTQQRAYGTDTGLFEGFPIRWALGVDGHHPSRAQQGPVHRLRLLGGAVGR